MRYAIDYFQFACYQAIAIAGYSDVYAEIRVKSESSDFWWLLALEAMLFLSLPCWVSAAYVRPATHPARFVLILIALAALGTLIFHIAPAFWGRQFGRGQNLFVWIVMLWLSAGYIYYSMHLLQALIDIFASSYGPSVRLAALIIGLLLLAILAFVRSWYKPVVMLGFIQCTVLLGLTLTTPLAGLWTKNLRWVSGPSEDYNVLWQALLMIAPPAMSIGWRIGFKEQSKRRVWLRGLLGFFLPLCFSVSIVALMAQAGENLYWRPSLPIGFHWAYIVLLRHAGSRGWTAWRWAIALTAIYPALLGVLSVKILINAWLPWMRITLFALAAFALCRVAIEPVTGFYPPYDNLQIFWAVLCAAIAGAAALSCLLVRRRNTSGAV